MFPKPPVFVPNPIFNAPERAAPSTMALLDVFNRGDATAFDVLLVDWQKANPQTSIVDLQVAKLLSTRIWTPMSVRDILPFLVLYRYDATIFTVKYGKLFVRRMNKFERQGAALLILRYLCDDPDSQSIPEPYLLSAKIVKALLDCDEMRLCALLASAKPTQIIQELGEICAALCLLHPGRGVDMRLWEHQIGRRAGPLMNFPSEEIWKLVLSHPEMDEDTMATAIMFTERVPLYIDDVIISEYILNLPAPSKSVLKAFGLSEHPAKRHLGN